MKSRLPITRTNHLQRSQEVSRAEVTTNLSRAPSLRLTGPQACDEIKSVLRTKYPRTDPDSVVRDAGFGTHLFTTLITLGKLQQSLSLSFLPRKVGRIRIDCDIMCEKKKKNTGRLSK